MWAQLERSIYHFNTANGVPIWQAVFSKLDDLIHHCFTNVYGEYEHSVDDALTVAQRCESCTQRCMQRDARRRLCWLSVW